MKCASLFGLAVNSLCAECTWDARRREHISGRGVSQKIVSISTGCQWSVDQVFAPWPVSDQIPLRAGAVHVQDRVNPTVHARRPVDTQSPGHGPEAQPARASQKGAKQGAKRGSHTRMVPDSNGLCRRRTGRSVAPMQGHKGGRSRSGRRGRGFKSRHPDSETPGQARC